MGVDWNLRGVTDVIDCSFDHESCAEDLLAVAKDKDNFFRPRNDQAISQDGLVVTQGNTITPH